MFGAPEFVDRTLQADRQVRYDLIELTAEGRIVRERGKDSLSQARKGRRILWCQPENRRPEPLGPVKPEVERRDRSEHAQQPVTLGRAKPIRRKERRQDRDVSRDAQARVGIKLGPMTPDHWLGRRHLDNQRALAIVRRHSRESSGRPRRGPAGSEPGSRIIR